MDAAPMPASNESQELFDCLRAIAGPVELPRLALTVARMIAAARLWPDSNARARGFLDQSRELTNADWRTIVETLAEHHTAAEGRFSNPFADPPEDPPLPPGRVEHLRRLILSYMFDGGPVSSVPKWLL